jgi:hypothetical protein
MFGERYAFVIHFITFLHFSGILCSSNTLEVLDKKEGVWEFFFYYRLVLREKLTLQKKY